MKASSIALLVAALAPAAALAQVSGSPFGFAKEATGGGDAAPAVPADIDELIDWLTDDTPRVILLDKEYDFLGSEGSETGHACRGIERCGADAGGQDTIKDECDPNETSIEATWDVAGRRGIRMASNKSVIGVGKNGILRGKGISIHGATNIIIQNVHFTEINPQFVWGGDALDLDGSDLIWIDHCKFSLTGRQFIVSGRKPSLRVTISNTEFDGRTEWSSACNGRHNWGVMLVGSDEQYTFAGNFFHDMASRSPKLGQTVTEGVNQHFLHGYNNLFRDLSGNAFDIDDNTHIVLEANVFEDVRTPINSGSESNGAVVFNVPTSGSAGTCQAYLGRDCFANSLSGSGEWYARENTAALERAADFIEYMETPLPAGDVVAFVEANAGIGKVNPGTGSPPASEIEEEDEEETSVPSPIPTSTLQTVVQPAPTDNGDAVASQWGQCGGINWSGPQRCAAGLTCTEINDWYSQCL